MEIGVHQVGSPEDLAFEGVVAVCQAIDLELDPGDPPTPRGELAGRWFAPAPDRRMHVWLATIDGTAVGAAVSDQELDGVNDAVAELDAMTDPAWRRRGVATALVHAALPVLAADGVRSLLGWTPTEAGAAFCAALGMTHRSDERCSRLRVADVDARQQQRWIDEGADFAAGYRLEGWVGVVGDDWIEPLAQAFRAMVDAPLDDIDWQPQAVTPARVRERELSWDRMGYDTVTSLALAPDGTGAGASQILVSRLRPPIGVQADTGVVAQHRGHRLGRWLKAANLRRALEHQPALDVLETYNAESNPYMLAINVDMGYRPHRVYGTYQGGITAAKAALGAMASTT
jgi:GNAT superfamily N-acetyltransferase